MNTRMRWYLRWHWLKQTQRNCARSQNFKAHSSQTNCISVFAEHAAEISEHTPNVYKDYRRAIWSGGRDGRDNSGVDSGHTPVDEMQFPHRNNVEVLWETITRVLRKWNGWLLYMHSVLHTANQHIIAMLRYMTMACSHSRWHILFYGRREVICCNLG